MNAAEKMRDACVADLRSMGRGYVAHYHDVLNKAAERVAAIPLPPDLRDADVERLRVALTEIDRLSLVIASAVHHSDPAHDGAVAAAILAARAALKEPSA